jgi:hypothetical protein
MILVLIMQLQIQAISMMILNNKNKIKKINVQYCNDYISLIFTKIIVKFPYVWFVGKSCLITQ